MKKRINLYLPEFRPQRQWLSLSQMSVAWGIVLFLLVGIAGGLQWLLSQRQDELARLQQHKQQVDSQIKTATQQLQLRHPDENLQRELKRNQEELQGKRLLLQYLQHIGPLQNQGFSLWLSDLAKAYQPAISLQEFSIAGDQVLLRGEAASNEAVPAWMSRFSAYPSLRDRRFSELKVERQKSGALRFQLQTEHAISTDNADKKAGENE